MNPDPSIGPTPQEAPPTTERGGVELEARALPIAFDLACIGCEYNLRTLQVDAACPECGRAVRETLDSFSRGWSRQEVDVWRRGCKWVGISGVLTAVVPAVGLAGAFVGGVWLSMLGPAAMACMVAVVIWAEHALWVMGVLRLTRGHPGVEQVSPGAIARLRVAVVANGGIAVPAVLMPMVAAYLTVREDEWMMLWGVLIAVGVAARGIAVVGVMRLLTRTLGAAGQLWKRRHLLITSTAVIILCIAQGLATLSTMFAAGSLGDGFFEFGAVVGMGSLFALPVVAVWAAVSVFRAGVAFKLPVSS